MEYQEMLRQKIADAEHQIAQANEYLAGYRKGLMEALAMSEGKPIEVPKEVQPRKRQCRRRTREELTKSIRYALEDTEWMTISELWKQIGGAHHIFKEVLKGLVDADIVRTKGKGTKNNPVKYQLVPEAKRPVIIRRPGDRKQGGVTIGDHINHKGGIDGTGIFMQTEEAKGS